MIVLQTYTLSCRLPVTVQYFIDYFYFFFVSLHIDWPIHRLQITLKSLEIEVICGLGFNCTALSFRHLLKDSQRIYLKNTFYSDRAQF